MLTHLFGRMSFGVALLIAIAAGSGFVSVDHVHAGGGFCHQAPAVKEADGELVEMIANCFTPTVLRVQPGTTVTFRNNDQLDHYVSGVALSWASPQNRPMKEGEAATFSFATEGTYPYSCNLHIGMTGAIVVGDGRASAGSVPVSEHRELLAAAPIAQQAPAVNVAAPVANESPSETRSLVYAGLGAVGGAVAAFAALGVRAARGSGRPPSPSEES